MQRFIKFDRYDNERPDNFGGHVYIDASQITSVVDESAGQELARVEDARTIIRHGNALTVVRHGIINVLASIELAQRDAVKSEAEPTPVAPAAVDLDAWRERTQHELFERLRNLAGYIENGTDTIVSFAQDDATKEWTVRVGAMERSSRRYRAPSLQAAFEVAFADPKNNHL